MEDQQELPELRYVGFWARVIASMIDSVLVLIVTAPLLVSVYGWEYLETADAVAGPLDLAVSWGLPLIATILFWMYKSATPGKMIIGAKIVDARTGQKPSDGQFVGRYFAYFLSALPLFLGFIWVAFDERKQGWHDKLANTVVVRQ